MKKLKQTQQLLSLIFILVVVFSCSKDSELINKELPSHENFVELSTIMLIADGIIFPVENDSSNLKTETSTKSINSIEEVKNISGYPSFYVVNYNEGGFVILSADKRTQPTLGFSVTNNFIVDESSYPPGLHDCDGTGVSSSADMSTVLKTQFNYSNASKADYNYNTVKNNISNNRPVILSGSNYNSGHMWVCDGYRTSTYYFEDCTAVGYLHFYMKWGWYNGQYNGWYAYNNFNPGNTNYNSNKKMIYNIIP